jgi:hypothetical protein
MQLANSFYVIWCVRGVENDSKGRKIVAKKGQSLGACGLQAEMEDKSAHKSITGSKLRKKCFPEDVNLRKVIFVLH